MSDDATEKFKSLLDDFDTAMFVTTTPDGQLRSRPMSIVEQSGNGDLQFVTGDDTGKIEELFHNAKVNVAMQSAKKFLSISGTAAVSRDRAQLEKLWTPAMKVWFPKGKNDPDMILIRVQAETGEYWDISGLNQLRFLFKAGKALLQGEGLEDYSGGDGKIHDKVTLR